MSDRAENLEAIELRLKNDILAEAHKYGGLILTHNEVGMYIKAYSLHSIRLIDVNSIRLRLRRDSSYMDRGR